MSTQTYVDTVTLTSATEFNRFDSAAYCVLTGVAGTNTITATGPANMVLTTPYNPIILIPANTNTGATTLNITPSGGSALTAKNVFCNGVACTGGELKAGVPSVLVYDGTRFQIVGPSGFSGTYTPTLTAGTNVTASTPRLTTWLKSGTAVTVAGQFDVDPTSTGAKSLSVSLPIASNFSTAFQGGGSGTTGFFDSVQFISDAANDVMTCQFTASNVANQSITFSFTYQVI